jgi:leucyl aminopeptidase
LHSKDILALTNVRNFFVKPTGKGVTFDTGGISIKPASKMEDMRADMGGAANVVGALQIIASLGLPLVI